MAGTFCIAQFRAVGFRSCGKYIVRRTKKKPQHTAVLGLEDGLLLSLPRTGVMVGWSWPVLRQGGSVGALVHARVVVVAGADVVVAGGGVALGVALVVLADAVLNIGATSADGKAVIHTHFGVSFAMALIGEPNPCCKRSCETLTNLKELRNFPNNLAWYLNIVN